MVLSSFVFLVLGYMVWHLITVLLLWFHFSWFDWPWDQEILPPRPPECWVYSLSYSHSYRVFYDFPLMTHKWWSFTCLFPAHFLLLLEHLLSLRYSRYLAWFLMMKAAHISIPLPMCSCKKQENATFKKGQEKLAHPGLIPNPISGWRFCYQYLQRSVRRSPFLWHILSTVSARLFQIIDCVWATETAILCVYF